MSDYTTLRTRETEDSVGIRGHMGHLVDGVVASRRLSRR